MNDPRYNRQNSGAPRNLQQEIQDALHSQDFTRLKDTIQDTVHVTVRQVKEGLSHLQDAIPTPKEETPPPKSYQEQVKQTVRRRAAQASPRPREVSLTPRKLPGETAALLQRIFGWCLTGIAGTLFLSTLLVTVFSGKGIVSTVFLGLSTGCGLWLLLTGTHRSNRIKRFRNYLQLMGEKGFYALKQLALDTGKTTGYLIKDLQSMIDDGFFSYAKWDEGKTCVILDAETYHQYERAQVAYLQKKSVQDQFKSHPEYEKMKRILDEGREYIRQIRQANDELPGEEISRKLDRLEISCTNLFDYVESHIVPASALRNAIDYYLPTTMKLVRGYQEFEKEPDQTEKIQKAKQDILDVLDTIPEAFDKLRDTLYRETILDLSADIVTLKTVFAQDGLVNDKNQMKRD